MRLINGIVESRYGMAQKKLNHSGRMGSAKKSGPDISGPE
jgi:hypothetical protein